MNTLQGMLSGMTASVSVRIQGVDDAILIPIEALHKTSDGAYVYTSYNEEYQEYGGKVDVVTGLENSTYVDGITGATITTNALKSETQAAIDFVKEHLGVEMERNIPVCTFSHMNNQCIGKNCPYCRS